MIGIIDYGAGNLHSVKNAFDYLKIKSRIIKMPEDMLSVKRIVLPGVGAFGFAVKRLRQTGLFDKIVEWLKQGRPFLGICLGLQLLFESSEESKGIKGFGIFKGNIKKFRKYKVPQIGWNSVEILKSIALFDTRKKTFFYFLHGYYVDTPQKELILGMTDYGIKYPSIINRENIYGVQFHPEKSGKMGLILLKNWVERC
uniref:Imidazole glycerol phosphate synthase subunit HisH n=1 Tax=candidate division WOR-3 bacterium TaxID=2052148 RepID=A0A7V0Z7E7_UNCW3